MVRPDAGPDPVVEPARPSGRDRGARPEPRLESLRRELLGADRADRADRRDRREPRDVSRQDRSPSRRDARRDAQRLDLPRESRRLIRRPAFDEDTFGRFAEQFARFMGTARFLVYMTAFVIAWIILNVVGLWGLGWDPYPFILLNLFFSTQASYAAPLILLAQNRQEDRDRVIAEGDRMANTRAHADMEFLAREMASLRISLGEVATRDYVRSELRALLQELEERAQPPDDQDGDQPDQRPDQRPDQVSGQLPGQSQETHDTRR